MLSCDKQGPDASAKEKHFYIPTVQVIQPIKPVYKPTGDNIYFHPFTSVFLRYGCAFVVYRSTKFYQQIYFVQNMTGKEEYTYACIYVGRQATFAENLHQSFVMHTDERKKIDLNKILPIQRTGKDVTAVFKRSLTPFLMYTYTSGFTQYASQFFSHMTRSHHQISEHTLVSSCSSAPPNPTHSPNTALISHIVYWLRTNQSCSQGLTSGCQAPRAILGL